MRNEGTAVGNSPSENQIMGSRHSESATGNTPVECSTPPCTWCDHDEHVGRQCPVWHSTWSGRHQCKCNGMHMFVDVLDEHLEAQMARSSQAKEPGKFDRKEIIRATDKLRSGVMWAKRPNMTDVPGMVRLSLRTAEALLWVAVEHLRATGNSPAEHPAPTSFPLHMTAALDPDAEKALRDVAYEEIWGTRPVSAASSAAQSNTRDTTGSSPVEDSESGLPTREEADRILRDAGYDPDKVGREMHRTAMDALAKARIHKPEEGWLLEPPEADEIIALCNSIRKASLSRLGSVSALDLAFADLALDWVCNTQRYGAQLEAIVNKKASE